MEKRLFLCALVLALSACGPNNTSATSWAYDFVKWNHHVYRVTSKTVKEVDKEIGEVTNYSGSESAKETGTYSNALPVGTKLFSIHNTDPRIAIAVEESNGSFVKAVVQEYNRTTSPGR